MGLDSVELLMRFEKEFKKDVPDEEAGKIITVGDMANWFFNNLNIKEPNKEVENIIFNLLKDAFEKLNLPNNFDYEQSLQQFIPKDNLRDTWIKLEKELNLKIPELNPQDLLNDKKSNKVKILALTLLKPKKPVLEMSFRRFVECIGALNYKNFVDFDNLTSLFEIIIVIIALTQEQSGVDIDEVFTDSSFVNDLGID